MRDQIVLNGIFKDHVQESTLTRQIVFTESVFIYKPGELCDMVLDQQICDFSDGHVPKPAKCNINIGVTLNAGNTVIVGADICPIL